VLFISMTYASEDRLFRNHLPAVSASRLRASGNLSALLPSPFGRCSRSGPMLHPSQGGGDRSHEGHAQARRVLQRSHLEARRTGVGGGHEVAAKDDALRSPRRSGWPASGSASVRPGRAALSARWTNVRLQGRVFCSPTEPAGAPYEVGRCAGPACPEPL
jgi:hypothetical protein